MTQPAQPPRKRPSLAEIFGEVLPDSTQDERGPEPDTPRDDSWYQHNRPPHHDRESH